MYMTLEKIKWGIIGCGDVTEVKSGPAFHLAENSKLVAVMRRDAAKAKDYAQRHKVSKWYSNADELINDSEVNAVYVATPPDTHAQYAIQAMRAGKPVYVEKPMALNYTEAQEMIAVSEETGMPLFVAYYRRSLPSFVKVKELIESSAIGTVRCVNIMLFKSPSEDEKSGGGGWRVNPEIAGAGHFFDLASHQLDYLDYLFGPIKKHKAFVFNHSGYYKAEDLVSTLFLFDKNISCSGTWCFSAAPESDRDTIEIVGSEGSILFSCFGFEPVRIVSKDHSENFTFLKPQHVQLPFIQEVVNDLLGKSTAPGNAVSASRTSEIMSQIVDEYYSNKTNI